MPNLRFTRDKRGYENTFLVHTFRRRGKSRQRILYWFRTPPNVKVGRSALDEDAIRSIEEHNPDLSFDWPKILELKPPPAPPPEGGPKPRPSRRVKDAPRRAAAKPSAPESGTAVLAVAEQARDFAERAELVAEPPEGAAVGGENQGRGDRRDAGGAAPGGDAGRSPVEVLIGREPASRLRARFLELQARITERGGDAARAETLRAQAASLNPDTWVTADEAKKGLEEFEPRLQELGRLLGLRKRRRSRRGGARRRRRQGGAAALTPNPAVGEASSSGFQGDELAGVGGAAPDEKDGDDASELDGTDDQEPE